MPKVNHGCKRWTLNQYPLNNCRATSIKKNIEREVARVGECLKKRSFKKNGLVEYTQFYKYGISRDKIYVNDMAGYIIY